MAIQTLLSQNTTKRARQTSAIAHAQGFHTACVTECFMEMAKLTLLLRPERARDVIREVFQIVKKAAEEEQQRGH